MSNYFNEAGEPLMDGAAMRYEMYLDSTYEPDPDDFYDRWGSEPDEDDDYEGGEDAYLDSYMEDRLSYMFE